MQEKNNKMTISLAKKEQLNEIHSLTNACALDLVSKDIYQWNEHYPPLDKLANDISRGELYCLTEENTILGIIVITEIEDKEYKDIEWLTEKESSIYIHRLATHPNFQGKGYARELMDFAEGFAMASGYKSVRLDTFSENTRNNKFYKSRGYKKLGDIFFVNQSIHPFHCYELIL